MKNHYIYESDYIKINREIRRLFEDSNSKQTAQIIGKFLQSLRDIPMIIDDYRVAQIGDKLHVTYVMFKKSHHKTFNLTGKR